MSRYSRLLTTVIAATAAALLLVTGPASALTGWSGPTAILTQKQDIRDVRMGVDDDGHISILGRDAAGLFALADHTGPWLMVRLVSDAQVSDYDEIAGVFDRAGHAWLAWSRDCAGTDCTQAGIWMLTDRHGGSNQGWPAEPVQLVAGRMRSPALQVMGDRIHLAYVDKKERVHYRTALSPQGPWTDVLVWGDSIDEPSMVLDTNGRANIVALHVPRLTWARDVGTPGSPSFRSRSLPSTGDMDARARIALDADGHAWIAWTHHDYCGVAPCPPDPTRGTWLRSWTGSRWSAPKHVSLSDVSAIRMAPRDRGHILTIRPSHIEQTPSGWEATVLRKWTVAYRHQVPASAMALTTDGRARVVFADTVQVDGRPRWALYLARER